MAVIVPNREPDKGAEWGFQECTYDVLIDYFVIAADEATVNLVVMRYAEAIVDVLQSQSIIGGRSQQNYEPPLTLSEATRHLIGGTAGDAFNGGLAVALARQMPLDDAVRQASMVGALSVTRVGAQPSLPTEDEVRRFAETAVGQ